MKISGIAEKLEGKETGGREASWEAQGEMEEIVESY